MSIPQPGKETKEIKAPATKKEGVAPKTVGETPKTKIHTNSVELGSDSMINVGDDAPEVDVEKELAAPVTEKSILVVATARGYYGHMRREPGDQFHIKHQGHLGSWMKRVK